MTGNRFSRVSGIMPPLNLLYLATYLKNRYQGKDATITVSILDLELEPLDARGLKEFFDNHPPDLVGITAHTNNMPAVARISRIAKLSCPAVKVVLGGPHPTVEPERTLQSVVDIDFISCGESEQTLLELVDTLRTGGSDLQGIRGLYFRDAKTGRISSTGHRDPIQNLMTVGQPDFNYVDIERYLKLPQSPGIWKRTWNMFTQRGCAFDCSFCASPKIHAYKVRFLPVSMVVTEIKEAVQKYRVEHVNFRDSNFTMNRARTIEICLELIRKGVKVSWNCETRVNIVDPVLLRVMKAAGCSKISFGVESGSPRILKKVDKKISLAQIKDAFEWCKNIGILTQAFFMVGFPTENDVDIQATKALIKQIKPDFLFVSVVVPLPGTRIFDEFKELGLIIDPDRYESFQFFFQAPAWRTLHHDVKDLVRLQRAMYSRYVFSLAYILRMVRQIRAWSQLRYYFGAILGFIDFISKRGLE
nr:radical SAM protein [Candidatus Sigynarchaeota archaeon]